MKLSGSCHCGEFRFDMDWPGDEPVIPARKCGCSFCTRFGAAWTSHPDARLEMYCSESGGPARYRFGTETADFLFCNQCGVKIAVVCELEGKLMAVVNVASFDDAENLQFDRSSSDFDGESLGHRLDRRSRRWIGQASLHSMG